MRIIAAAIKLDDGTVFALAPHARHHDVIAMIRETGREDDVSGRRQGFIADDGTFFGRRLSMIIARQACQLIAQPVSDELFSEDVW